MTVKIEERPAVYGSILQVLPIDQVHESHLNSRRRFDPAGLKELAESVKSHGILTPLLVRPRDGSYEIAAGARRIRAAKKAGLKEVPAIVREMDDVQFLEIVTIENLQREDVHPLDEAHGYLALIEKASYTPEAIADRIGKSESYVYQRLKLADLIPAAQKAFLEEKITASHAILIARLQPGDQETLFKQELFEREWIGGGAARRQGAPISVRALEQWINQNILLDLNGAPWKKDDATLFPEAGPCTTCPKRAGNQPQLFPDVKKGDTCTDPSCFAVKMANFIERRVVNEQLIKLADYGEDTKEKGVILGGSWQHVTDDSCKFARKGIIVVSDRRLGQVLTVCVDRTCKTHGPGRYESVGHSSQYAADQRKRNREVKIKSTVRERILTAVLENVKTPLVRKDFEFLARQTFSRVYHEGQKRVCLRHGLEPTKGSYGMKDYEKPVLAVIPKMKDQELAQFLYECALAADLAVSPYDSGKPEDLLIAAKARRVNATAIERRVRKEFAVKANRTKVMNAKNKRSKKPETSVKRKTA